VCVRSFLESGRNEFRPVINAEALGEPVEPYELSSTATTRRAGERRLEFGGEALAREGINDIERAELAAPSTSARSDAGTDEFGIGRTARSLRGLRRFTLSPAAR
jgi:hypothetical protein